MPARSRLTSGVSRSTRIVPEAAGRGAGSSCAWLISAAKRTTARRETAEGAQERIGYCARGRLRRPNGVSVPAVVVVVIVVRVRVHVLVAMRVVVVVHVLVAVVVMVVVVQVLVRVHV